jgi:hypothetical protein
MEGAVAAVAGLSAGLAPKLKPPNAGGADFSASAGFEVEAGGAKLKPPDAGAGVLVAGGLEAGSEGFAPKLKEPIGASFSDGGAGVVPNEKAGAAALIGSAAVSAGLAPKVKGAAAATTGVADPESGADLRPKKSGTPPDSLAGGVEAAGAGAEGLPSPKLNAGFLLAFEGAADPNSGAGVEVGAGGFAPPEREKKPFSLGVIVCLGSLGFCVSGESGSATMDPAARGEEARGRLALSRDKGPRAGTPRLEGAGAGGRLSEVSLFWAGCAVGAAGGGSPKLPNFTPENEGSEILVCSSSSISGKSSSLAEYRPPAEGEVARDPCADEPCALFVFSVRARKLDCCFGQLVSGRGWLTDPFDFSLGEGAVSVIVGTGGTGGVASRSGEEGSAVALRLRRPVSFGADVSMAAFLINPLPFDFV